MTAVSPLAAAERAGHETGQQLFSPVHPKRWLALGLAAFLDQCGRSGGFSFQVPGNFGGGEGGGPGRQEVENALAWLGSHVLLVTAAAAAVIALVVALTALVLWLQSRGTFMYLDNVATGRCDIARPWREHAGRAGSYFVWVFVLAMATLLMVLACLVPIGWSVLALARHGARPGPIATLVVAGLGLVVLGLAASLLSVALRDFVAPLQWFAGLSCGGALRLFGSLLRAHPGSFVVYLLLKIAVHLVIVVVSLALCCLTCCLGMLPVIYQALMQPVFYFERRLSLELLAQLGFSRGTPEALA